MYVRDSLCVLLHEPADRVDLTIIARLLDVDGLLIVEVVVGDPALPQPRTSTFHFPPTTSQGLLQSHAPSNCACTHTH
eukprot:scaffold2501_cov423-Prasinococcus_capsulatus_cf.AAC.7